MTETLDRTAAFRRRLTGATRRARPDALRGSGVSAARVIARLALAAPAALAVLALATAPALAVRGHVFSKSFDGAGKHALKEPSAVAVSEATGRVYVLDQGNGRVEWFSSAGVFEGEFNGTEIDGKPAGAGNEAPAKFSFGAQAATGGIAVDNTCALKNPASEKACATDASAGDVYVADVGNKVVDKFNPEGKYLGQLKGGRCEVPVGCFRQPTPIPFGTEIPFELLDGVAVDAKGEVWVYDQGLLVSNFSDASPNAPVGFRDFLGNGGMFGEPGFAVDTEDNLYLDRGNKEDRRVTKLGNHGEVTIADFGELITEAVDTEESSGVTVDLSTSEPYLDNVGSIGRFSSERVPVEDERFGAGHLTSGGGLAVSAEAGLLGGAVFVADTGSNAVQVFVPEPPGPPTVQGESVSDVSGEAATLEGQVNPRGTATEARFEYGRCSSPPTCSSSGFEASTPFEPVGSQFAVASLHPVHVQGLSPDTTYHFRVLARNAHAPVNGAGEGERGEHGEELVRGFTTQLPGGSFVLPDGRAWELVSPADKHGAAFEHLGGIGGVIQSAAGGGAFAFLSLDASEADPQGAGVDSQSARDAGCLGLVLEGHRDPARRPDQLHQ